MHVVEVSLVNVASHVRDDPDGERIQELTESVLNPCWTARSYLSARQEEQHDSCADTCCSCGCLPGNKTPSFQGNVAESPIRVQRRLVTTVTKYVKSSDRYLALSSVLFKSQAFHRVYSSPRTEKEPLTIVELPRTKNQKPFIPTDSFDTDGSDDRFPLSISHQFPYCGMARFPVTDGTLTNEKLPQLGLDIVTYDRINTNLYDSVMGFLEMFRDSFTQGEWDRIVNYSTEDEIILREFYLRWAIKEAYTKALGIGFGLEFSSFEAQLVGVDDRDNEESGGICARVCQNKDVTRFCATIRYRDRSTDVPIPASKWEFFFLPLLGSHEQVDSKPDIVTDAHSGCACICVGNFHDDCTEVRVKWTTLEELTRWHEESSF